LSPVSWSDGVNTVLRGEAVPVAVATPPAAGEHELQVVRAILERVYDFSLRVTFASSRPTRARCGQLAS